jgi:hypothetical protein
MTVHHILQVVYALVAGVGLGVASAAATHDYSDSWWSPDEPGAGISVQQQADVLFIQLFLYRRDGGPTWFSGAAFPTSKHPGGHDVFTGDLYQTTGPYFGTTWNPSAMEYRQVGSLTFDAASVNAATLAYMIDGVPFTKKVNRLTRASENLAGYYYMGWNANCEGIWRTYFDTQIVLSVSHQSDDAITLQMFRTDVPDRRGPMFNGTYSQTGHLGQIVAEMTYGGSGSALFFDVEKSAYGFTARVAGTLLAQGVECRMENGRIGAVRFDP